MTPPMPSVAFARNVRRDCSSGVPGSAYDCAWGLVSKMMFLRAACGACLLDVKTREKGALTVV